MSSSPGIGPQINPQPLPEQPSARKRWIDLGLVLIIAFADPIVSAVFALFHPEFAASPMRYPGLSISYLILRHGTAFLALWYVLSRRQRSIRSIGLEFRFSDPFKGVGLMILAFILVAGLHFLVISVDHAFGIVPDTRTVADAGWKQRSVAELIHDFSSPIFEEVLVRGYLMTELIELGKPVAFAIAASVILQTSYHVYYGLGRAVALSGVFIVFAAYFAKTRRLTPVILAHLFWDMILYFVK
jgi:membrane protease YdiL (CAAX protease family)